MAKNIILYVCPILGFLASYLVSVVVSLIQQNPRIIVWPMFYLFLYQFLLFALSYKFSKEKLVSDDIMVPLTGLNTITISASIVMVALSYNGWWLDSYNMYTGLALGIPSILGLIIWKRKPF